MAIQNESWNDRREELKPITCEEVVGYVGFHFYHHEFNMFKYFLPCTSCIIPCFFSTTQRRDPLHA